MLLRPIFPYKVYRTDKQLLFIGVEISGDKTYGNINFFKTIYLNDILFPEPGQTFEDETSAKLLNIFKKVNTKELILLNDEKNPPHFYFMCKARIDR